MMFSVEAERSAAGNVGDGPDEVILHVVFV